MSDRSRRPHHHKRYEATLDSVLVELVIAKLLVVTIGMLFVLYSLYGGSMYNERSIRETEEQ